MSRPTLAFFDIPYHSRLVTTLPLVKGLVDRGHRVVVFTLEPLRALVEATGAEVAIQPDFGPEPPDCSVNLRTIDYSMTAVTAIEHALSAIEPAAVIFTSKCLWAALAADRLGLPTIAIHTNGLWPRETPLSDRVDRAGISWHGKTRDEVDALMARDRVEWHRCRRHFAPHRIKAIDVVPLLPNAMNLRGDLNLVYSSAELQPHRDAFGPDYRFVGPCYDTRPADADPSFVARVDALPRPRIFAALGSMPSYNDRPALMRAVFDALTSNGHGLVMATGSPEAMDALDPLPPAVAAAPYVPQLAMLDRVDVFVTHAGTNSAYEALLAGVPLVMVPQAADQYLLAEHYSALGLGIWCDEPNDPAQLKAAVDAALADDDMRRRVKAAGDTLRAAGGLTRAIESIEAFAGEADRAA